MINYFLNNFPTETLIFMVLALLWTLPWKGVALWQSARRKQLGWFIALLLINTLGLLEILYIFIWGKQKPKVTEPSV